jgi:uncharacterized repeat protein (TIGR03803 family)
MSTTQKQFSLNPRPSTTHFLSIYSLLTLGFLLLQPLMAQYTNVHNFAGGANDGNSPYGSLTLAGSSLYGMTYSGGASNYGVVFRMNTNGAAYTNLHSFAGGAIDGATPRGSLMLSGSTLYGMTSSGGTSNKGVIFGICTNGTGYTNLHNFAGGAIDGATPYGSLTQTGSILYGMTYSGGASNQGVVFRISTDGADYTNLHSFAGGAMDGAHPFGSITFNGSVLYGMTYSGGVSNQGVAFGLSTNGSGYTNLHSFVGTPKDGAYPGGSLTCDGSALYGMTSGGGVVGAGVLFTMDTHGAGYTNLHNFAGGVTDGTSPFGSLTLAGASLFGVTVGGGSANCGILFKITTDGTGYTNLHTFGGPPNDGNHPNDSLTLNGSTLYGTTVGGGSSFGGVVFSQPFTPDPEVIITKIEVDPSGFRLQWQGNRRDLWYAVESCTSLVQAAFSPRPPTNQWPVTTTWWTNSQPLLPHEFFRVKATVP